MKAVHMGMLAGALAGSLTLGAAQAQTAGTSGGAAPSAPTAGSTGTATGSAGMGGTSRPMATSPGTGTTSMGTPPAGPSGTMGATGRDVVNRNTGTAAASGDTNQAVATTAANAPQPARGRNSFTMGEARRRIERNGYGQVADLKKDNNGVWRGHAQKDGATVNVWLDYKGNVGQN